MYISREKNVCFRNLMRWHSVAYRHGARSISGLFLFPQMAFRNGFEGALIWQTEFSKHTEMLENQISLPSSYDVSLLLFSIIPGNQAFEI